MERRNTFGRVKKGRRFIINRNEKRWILLILGLALGFLVFGLIGGLLDYYEEQITNIPWIPDWFSIKDGLDWILPIIGFALLGIVGLQAYLDRENINKMIDDNPRT